MLSEIELELAMSVARCMDEPTASVCVSLAGAEAAIRDTQYFEMTPAGDLVDDGRPQRRSVFHLLRFTPFRMPRHGSRQVTTTASDHGKYHAALSNAKAEEGRRASVCLY